MHDYKIDELLMKVKIFDHSGGNTELMGTWTLDEAGKAVCDNARYAHFAAIEGVTGIGKVYYPKDGKDFLRALPVQLRGTYVWAELEE